MKEEKIYLVIEEDCFNFENNQNVTVFKEYKDAAYFVQKRIDEVLKDDEYFHASYGELTTTIWIEENEIEQ